MNNGKRLLASFAAVATLGFSLFSGAARAQQESPPEQPPAPIVMPQVLTEKFDVLAHACTADQFNVGANATIAVRAADAAAAGKEVMVVGPDGHTSFKLNLTPEEHAALQTDLDDLWAAAAAEMNAATDLPNPAPPDFGFEQLKMALTDNLPAFQTKASHDLGIPVGISGFNYKIPVAGCPAPDAKP